MRDVTPQVDRCLTLLGNTIRDRSFTQLRVQEELGWGRSYLSQLMTKQKKLRIDQLLSVLSAIGVEPAEFFAELYPTGMPAVPPVVEPAPDDFAETASIARVLVQLLLARGIITEEELAAAVAAERRRL